jgi:hypothetical protein
VRPRHTSVTSYGKWLEETPYFPGLFEEIHGILLHARELGDADWLAAELLRRRPPSSPISASKKFRNCPTAFSETASSTANASTASTKRRRFSTAASCRSSMTTAAGRRTAASSAPACIRSSWTASPTSGSATSCSAACASASVYVYAAEGKVLLQLLNFRQQARSESKYPPPDAKHLKAFAAHVLSPSETQQMLAHAQQMIAGAHLGVFVFGGVVVSEDVVVVGPAKRDRRLRPPRHDNRSQRSQTEEPRSRDRLRSLPRPLRRRVPRSSFATTRPGSGTAASRRPIRGPACSASGRNTPANTRPAKILRVARRPFRSRPAQRPHRRPAGRLP